MCVCVEGGGGGMSRWGGGWGELLYARKGASQSKNNNNNNNNNNSNKTTTWNYVLSARDGAFKFFKFNFLLLFVYCHSIACFGSVFFRFKLIRQPR